MAKNIILDTDIGGDADDAFALLLALNSPELKVDLVVTNDEHRGDRARFAKRLIRLMKRDVPVVSGTDLGNDRVFVIGDLVKGDKSKVEHDFLKRMREVVERNKLTYFVCIGPQSNIAKFIESYPELKGKVELLIMAGSLNRAKGESAEHNVRYDISAAKAVLESGWKKRYVSSDVTRNDKIKIGPQSKILKSLEESPKEYHRLVAEAARAWHDKMYPSSWLHDPLILSTLIDKSLAKFRTEKVAMDESGFIRRNRSGTEMAVAYSADYEKFLKMLERRALK